VNTSFILTILVLLKNTGAKPVAIGEIRWFIDEVKYLNVNVMNKPDFVDNNDLCILPPYEHKLSTLRLTFELKGFGKGFNNDEYIESITNIKESLENNKILLNIKYKVLFSKCLVNTSKKYNIHKLISDGITRFE
jgi:hypothetical protein